jgi:glycosyltransferase involved in cell wall biosynthesis
MSSETQLPFSIVVPARDEEETIGAVLRDIRDFTDDLIVVDGASSDRTVEIARAHGARILHDRGRGKGDAVRVGIHAARFPVVVFIDADGSHDPADIPKLVAPIVNGEADLVMGSRMLGGSEELFGSFSEVVRMVGSMVISLTINYRYGVRLTDYQNGFRAIRTDVARALDLKSRITTIEQEMAMKCLRHGLRVTERPAHEFPRRGGVSKVSVRRRAPQYVWNLFCGVVGPRRPLPVLVAASVESKVFRSHAQEAQDG